MKRGLLALCLLLPAASAAAPDWVELRDGRFVLAPSGTFFVPWGFNYDRDYRFRLLDEYWDTDWSTVERDFRSMRALGANTVRVHLQFARFMDSPDAPNRANLEQLEKLARLAEGNGMYLDVTGLATTRESSVPSWYTNLSERDRWAAQARFWEAVAQTCASRPGIFAYDLMNEPLVAGDRRPSGSWIHPKAINGLHYLEYINLNPAGRQRTDISRAWLHQMRQAVRKYDRKHLITVGMVLLEIGKPEEAAGFGPARIAPELDFLALHVYPKKGKVNEALATLARCRAVKPVIIEEVFPLGISLPEMKIFLDRSRESASGWISHFWGQTPEELRTSTAVKDRKIAQWLEMFRSMKVGQALPPSHY